ncbi:hypothetical protein J2W56_006604 [Nocardia kruczakiae]|uniref:HEAT repeat protein n=1 Tax=Nocardia kruczakiae TaxID=261477 RepID=A0ABU1XQM5_9NOCA|nr:hypothetical protein [Nocardia kruczakiae]
MRLDRDRSNSRSLAVHALSDIAPHESTVAEVADVVLGYVGGSGATRHDAVQLLDLLVAGVTEDNLVERTRMLAGKARRLARTNETSYVWLGVEALSLELSDHPHPMLLFAHYLSRLISLAQQWDVEFEEQWRWVKEMRGEVGDRLRGVVLAAASDRPLHEAVTHIAGRIKHALTTAEDLRLVQSITGRNPTTEDLQPWVEACGTPSLPLANQCEFPNDWRRMWRWYALLPESVLTAWTPVIARMSQLWGEQPTTAPLIVDQRIEVTLKFTESPPNSLDLSGKPPRDTIMLLTSHASTEGDGANLHEIFERARALEDAVKADPVQWSTAPQEIMEALGSAQFIERYIRGLTASAADIVNSGRDVVSAALACLVSSVDHSHPPQVVGEVAELEGLQMALLELVASLANRDVDLAGQLDELWRACTDVINSVPEDGEVSASPLERVLNSVWGHGLRTMLALAGWEHRKNGTVREQFTQTLDRLLTLVTASGLEFRALLASSRPFLESIADDWLEARLLLLFRNAPFGEQTFELTLKWAHPTAWLCDHCCSDLFEAAKRDAHNAARVIALAVVHEAPGYDLDTVLNRLTNHPSALAEAVEHVAYLVQAVDNDSPTLRVAVAVWHRLLDAGLNPQQASALIGLGRWSFVDRIDDAQWLRLTARTLEQTNGHIAYPTSVADRVARGTVTADSCRVFIQLLDNSDEWDRPYVATKAIAMLRDNPGHAHAVHNGDCGLRIRLIDLGFFDARNNHPSEATLSHTGQRDAPDPG